MRRSLLALACAAALAPAAEAVRPQPGAREDARRFGLDRLRPARRRAGAAPASAVGARAVLKSPSGGGWRVRVNGATGFPSALVGGRDSARPGRRPEDAGLSFLSSHRGALGVDPAALRTERQSRGPGLRHVLYRQTHGGLPVEFSTVKVHLDEDGAVVGVNSTYVPGVSAPSAPAVSAETAARAAETDAGGGRLRGAPALVILPLDSDGRDHLAWKMRVDARGGGWRYYVDAVTGQVLLRHSVLRFACAGPASGVISGQVYDIDPIATPLATRRFNHQYVYQPNGAGGITRSVSGGDPDFGQGFYCSTQTARVAMSLQGPYVNVAEFTGPSAHHDNGGGVWSTASTPVSSPHPYQNSTVHVTTISLSAATNAVKFLPIFSSFDVGGFSGGSSEYADITDDDKVVLYDAYGSPVATYVGARGGFKGAAVPGRKMNVVLRPNESGTANGYDVGVSSYLALTLTGAGPGSHLWTTTSVPSGLRSEISLFYHLNAMHDYFFADVNRSSAAAVVRPVVAMAHVGPNLVNAFYDPDFDDLSFGDVDPLAPSDIFADDATVARHEYVHYIVEKIWPIQNFGQAGAISEAIADYFAASSLDHSAIGGYVVQALGGTGALRELDCPSQTACRVLGSPSTPWGGEIHDDSLYLSQALWDLRKNRVTALGSSAGRSCADGLAFQSLLFFPEGFAEFYEAMLQADARGAVAACGAAGSAQAAISSAFSAHGLLPAGGDAYEPNDGFETAVDLASAGGSASATVYPGGDADFWSFGAGPGLVELSLSLPAYGSSLYKAYQMKLYDVSRRLVASAAPPYNGFGTFDGYCDIDCTTTQGQVRLNYNNPSGGLLYVQVTAGDGFGGSNSGATDDPAVGTYRLSASYPQAGALSGSIVSASFDRDAIAFSVDVSSFGGRQDWSFAYARLRDHAHAVMPDTLTNQTGDYLELVSASNAHGRITGQARLAPGFSARFPSAGTVHLEVFGYDVLGSTVSLGESNAINLTAAEAGLAAYNNVFDPLRGQKATLKYSVTGSGRLTLKLYTVTGRHVLTLFDGDVPAGKGSVDWAGRNSAGSVVASGVYVVRAEGPGLKETRKIAVVK